ncbi:SMC-Scp complex subunit ScpB [Bifidobacterium sp. MA2]|uniref:SMC-Scp complex subunit ScpB n=2 Tax=Bifidobacterium santillanense TaxID=2809028 RepID=A0ABS5UMQ6_9BIFI|nr:SMC-Scp complex subunit ScpB [Bifidobacterium santillanense]
MDVNTNAADRFPGGLGACLEAILMAAGEPQHAGDLARALGVDEKAVTGALERLQASYETAGHGFELRRTARGWRFASRVEFEPVVAAFVTDGQSVRLSQAAMETLAVIAYRQPVTRARVSSIRGVNCDGVVRSLLVRGLVREDGVDEESRASRLVTTDLFLEKMGVESLDDLPSLAPFLPEADEVLEEVAEDGVESR